MLGMSLFQDATFLLYGVALGSGVQENLALVLNALLCIRLLRQKYELQPKLKPSYRNNTIITFFLVANKNEDNAKRALASSNS